MTDREKDAVLAEKVMGWKCLHERGQCEDVPDDVECIIYHEQDGGVQAVLRFRPNRTEPWRPTTDPAAMVELIEGMRKIGWMVRVQAMPEAANIFDGKSFPKYVCMLDYLAGRNSSDPEERQKFFHSYPHFRGDTPMQAVAAAAMAVVEGEGKP